MTRTCLRVARWQPGLAEPTAAAYWESERSVLLERVRSRRGCHAGPGADGEGVRGEQGWSWRRRRELDG